MQQSWRQDADKLTFIVCQPSPTGTGGSPLRDDDDSSARMIGDVNLFLRVDDGEEGDADPQIIGEVELMIAEKSNQRKGFGKATLLSFLRYIADHEGEILEEFVRGDQAAAKALGKAGVSGWRLSCLSVKIGQGNGRSLGLFEGAGVSEGVGRSELFWRVRAQTDGFESRQCGSGSGEGGGRGIC